MKTIKLDFSKKLEDILIKEDSKISGLYIASSSNSFLSDFKIEFLKSNLKTEIEILIYVPNKCNIELHPTVVIKGDQKDIDCKLKIKVLCNFKESIIRVTPAMECMNPNVKLSHSLSIATFNIDDITYLRSRGLSDEQAKETLINAFTNINKI